VADVTVLTTASSSYQLGYSTPKDFDMPSGIVDGDFLVALIVNSAGNGLTFASGWLTAVVKSTGRPDCYIAYKRSTGGNDTLTISSSLAAWWWCYAIVHRCSGVRVVDPIGDTNISAGTSASAAKAPTVEITTAGGMAVGVVGWSVYGITDNSQTWPDTDAGADWVSSGQGGSTSSSGAYYRATATNSGGIGFTGDCTLDAPSSQLDQYNGVSAVLEADPTRRFFIS
jgi:hypothetical protein